MRIGSPFLLSVFLAVPRRSDSFSSKTTPAPLPPFARFKFAENGVSIYPSKFLCEIEGKERMFTMRNVPGDGDCMFLAVALATATSMGLGGNNAVLCAIASETRNVVAQVLASDGYLHIEDDRTVSAPRLLQSASKELGMTPEKYLEELKMDGSAGGLYGGGTELVVLSNVLRRPISVYELDHKETTKQENGEKIRWERDGCRINRVGIFGGSMFSDPCLNFSDSAVLSGLQPGAYSWHLHVLVVDANARQKHACVLLPSFCDLP